MASLVYEREISGDEKRSAIFSCSLFTVSLDGLSQRGTTRIVPFLDRTTFPRITGAISRPKISSCRNSHLASSKNINSSKKKGIKQFVSPDIIPILRSGSSLPHFSKRAVVQDLFKGRGLKERQKERKG